MRRITAGLYVSLDGVVDGTSGWQGPYFTAELIENMAAGLDGFDAVLLGRTTYDMFSGIWPPLGTDGAMPRLFNTATKYVVTSRDGLDWGPAERVSTDDIAAIKETDGGGVLVPGSPSLVAWLLREGLLDELIVNVMPVVVGVGARLFTADRAVPLELASSTTLSNGVLSSTYRPA